MELSDDELQPLVHTLLAPLQAYCEPAALQTMQFCLHHFLLTTRTLYQQHFPTLRRLSGVNEGWRFISMNERVAVRYQCWQCLREIETLCARLVPWGHLISATLTTMLEQLERLPDPTGQSQSSVASTANVQKTDATLSARAGQKLALFFKPYLEVYNRQPAFQMTFGRSSLDPRILRMLDTGFLSLLHSLLNLLAEALPAMPARLSRGKHQQAMALLNLLQNNDLLVKQTIALLQGLNKLRSQDASTPGNTGEHMKRS